MSLVTRSTTANMDANQNEQVLAGAVAGENLDIAAPCYLKSSDGLVYMCNATSANEAAEFIGFTARATLLGQPVTLFGAHSRFKYGTGLTPGDVFYMGATAGRLDTAATTGDPQGLAVVVSSTDIVVTRSSSVALTTTGAGSLTGTQVATVAESNVIGGIPLIFEIPVVAGALGNTDITVTHKIRVLDAKVILRGAGVSSTTLQVKNGTNAITDAMAASGSDKAVVRNTQIDDAYYEIAAAGTLRVTSATGATQPDALVVVTAVRVA